MPFETRHRKIAGFRRSNHGWEIVTIAIAPTLSPESVESAFSRIPTG
jgi:hypothetical protein